MDFYLAYPRRITSFTFPRQSALDWAYPKYSSRIFSTTISANIFKDAILTAMVDAVQFSIRIPHKTENNTIPNTIDLLL